MISYELILSSAILIIIFLTGSFNFTTIIEIQQAIWFIVPLFPVFLFYFIAVLAETSRTPFDLQEAESELVSGFMTEHSSVPFVFFFLGEYSSIVLFSSITSILFFGGYNMPEIFVNESVINLQSFILGLKTCFPCFFCFSKSYIASIKIWSVNWSLLIKSFTSCSCFNNLGTFNLSGFRLSTFLNNFYNY